MKTLMKRMAVMSVALVLLCVSAVAQNEKSNENVTNVTNDSSHGVIVSPSYVQMKPGDIKCVVIILEPGYVNPVLIYHGESFELNNQKIHASCFVAEITSLGSSGGIITITANSNVNSIDSDVFYVKAMIDYGNNGWNRSTTVDYGIPITVVVDPNYVE